jgi:hypothetical protein
MHVIVAAQIAAAPCLIQVGISVAKITDNR